MGPPFHFNVMRTFLLALPMVLTVVTIPVPLTAQTNSALKTPVMTNGWLLIQGGGDLTYELRQDFVALAGGPDAHVVLIPTAESDEQIRTGDLTLFGLKNLTVLHTRDRTLADSASFVEPLRHASGVWVGGGRQARLADAYLGTAVEREIKALLGRGGVVGGGSAGATIQGSFLVRGDPGTPAHPDGDNTIMMVPGHETGFGLLPNTAIDQHIDTRQRTNDLQSVIAVHPELLGIGIYEGAAIIAHGGSFCVVDGKAVIHDGKKHDGIAYYCLSPGETFNLATRSLEASGKRLMPEIERAVARWSGRNEVTIKPEHYNGLVGQYQANKNGMPVLIIHRDGDRLMCQPFGRGENEIYPESQTNYFFKVMDAQISFERDIAGAATGLILHANGADVSFKKFSEEVFTTHQALTTGDYEPCSNSLIQGCWQGTVSNRAQGSNIIVRIAERSPYKYDAELDSTDRHANGQMLSVVCHPPDVKLVLMAGRGMFDGRINNEGTTMTGSWIQGETSTLVVFRLVESRPEVSQPVGK